MDLKALKGKLKVSIANYKYVLIVLAIGMLLMLIPTAKSTDNKEVQTDITIPQITQEEKLSAILKQIQGVGEVQVLLSTENTGEMVYQTDTDITEGGGTNTQRNETVILTDSNRNQTALIRSCASPTYRGAVIVCQGGDLASVTLAVTQAVIKTTGLTADRICVLKMK